MTIGAVMVAAGWPFVLAVAEPTLVALLFWKTLLLMDTVPTLLKIAPPLPISATRLLMLANALLFVNVLLVMVIVPPLSL